MKLSVKALSMSIIHTYGLQLDYVKEEVSVLSPS